MVYTSCAHTSQNSTDSTLTHQLPQQEASETITVAPASLRPRTFSEKLEDVTPRPHIRPRPHSEVSIAKDITKLPTSSIHKDSQSHHPSEMMAPVARPRRRRPCQVSSTSTKEPVLLSPAPSATSEGVSEIPESPKILRYTKDLHKGSELGIVAEIGHAFDVSERVNKTDTAQNRTSSIQHSDKPVEGRHKAYKPLVSTILEHTQPKFPLTSVPDGSGSNLPQRHMRNALKAHEASANLAKFAGDPELEKRLAQQHKKTVTNLSGTNIQRLEKQTLKHKQRSTQVLDSSDIDPELAKWLAKQSRKAEQTH